MYYCNCCGKQIKHTVRFCPNCGSAVKNNLDIQTTTDLNNSDYVMIVPGRKLAIASMILGIIAIFFIVVGMIRPTIETVNRKISTVSDSANSNNSSKTSSPTIDEQIETNVYKDMAKPAFDVIDIKTYGNYAMIIAGVGLVLVIVSLIKKYKKGQAIAGIILNLTSFVLVGIIHLIINSV